MSINSKQISLFWDLFSYVDWTDSDMIELRKITKNSDFQDSTAAQPAFVDINNWLAEKCEREAGQIGYFMCPGVLNDRKANDNSVKALVCLSLDIDRGDTDKALLAARAMLGQPTLVVHSGGFTETGHKKMHIHWKFSEPETNVKKVAHAREILALQLGGDISFKRIPQVIRIPGTIYDKTGRMELVEVLESQPNAEINFSDAWDILEGQTKHSGLDFSKAAETGGNSQERFVQLTTEKIHEGGLEDSRFSRFTEYAGRWVAHARSGDCTVDEAIQHVANWTAENMVPAWPSARIQKEFNAILKVDHKNHPDAWAATQPAKPPVPEEKQNDWSWLNFRATDYFKGKPKPIPFLVKEMIVEGAVHSLVADGGVGKTYVGLEMALRTAMGGPHNNMFGFEVTKQCVSIMITVEDTKDDLHRRLHNIDPGGVLLKATNGRFFVLPVADEILGGLTLVEKDKAGNHKASAAWTWLVDKMDDIRKEFPNHPFFVVLDTYSATHHGDENSSAGTNEWFRAAGLLRNRYNAAIMVTHHVRKNSSKAEPITTPADFRESIRGSNAFQNSCRIVYGIFEMIGGKQLAQEVSGSDEEKASMQFYNFAPLKSNIGLDWTDRTDPKHKDPIITLRRTGTGQLIYDADIHEKRITHKDRAKAKVEKEAAGAGVQLEAAIILSVREYALAGRPVNTTELSKEKDIYLPYPASEAGRPKIEKTLSKLILDGKIIKKEVKSGRFKMACYDVPDGRYASGAQEERANMVLVMKWNEWEYDAQKSEYIRKG